MQISTIRAFFILISGVVGYYVGTLLEIRQPVMGLEWPVVCTLGGFVLGLIVVLLEMQFERVTLSGLSSIVFGLVLGILMAKLIATILRLLPLSEFVLSVTEIILTLVFSYFGVVMSLRGKDEFNLVIPYVRFKRQNLDERFILMDTSAIIDGRFQDIYAANFMSGRLVIPRFVLAELQALADSNDENKRKRGHRGLEIMQKMREDGKIDFRIHEDELAEKGSVDDRLVALAKVLDASICTTDNNLDSVASTQGLEVLNVNTIAEAVKPDVHSGDKFDIQLSKEGKEKGQAVGYLPDGTMVVVEKAAERIGQNVNVVVDSVIQTQSGRMVFAKVAG